VFKFRKDNDNSAQLQVGSAHLSKPDEVSNEFAVFSQ
jgi:hypothetical protein